MAWGGFFLQILSPARCQRVGPFSALDVFDAAMTILRAAAYDPV